MIKAHDTAVKLVHLRPTHRALIRSNRKKDLEMGNIYSIPLSSCSKPLQVKKYAERNFASDAASAYGIACANKNPTVYVNATHFYY